MAERYVKRKLPSPAVRSYKQKPWCPSQPLEWLPAKAQAVTGVGSHPLQMSQDLENRKPLYTRGGKVKWYSHDGKLKPDCGRASDAAPGNTPEGRELSPRTRCLCSVLVGALVTTATAGRRPDARGRADKGNVCARIRVHTHTTHTTGHTEAILPFVTACTRVEKPDGETIKWALRGPDVQGGGDVGRGTDCAGGARVRLEDWAVCWKVAQRVDLRHSCEKEKIKQNM